MPKHIGRLISVGLAKETTRGTRVASQYWLPTKSADHSGKREYVHDDSALGVIHDAQESEVVKEWAEGGFSALMGSDHFGLVLLGLFGTVGSVESADAGVYDHTFTVDNTAQHDTLTIELDQPNGDKSYSLAAITNLEVAFELGKYLDYTAGFMSKKGATQALTPAYASESRFRPQDLTVKFAGNAAGLAAASAVCVKSLTLTVEKNVESDDCLGDKEPQDFVNKSLMITGSLTLNYDSQTYENLALNGTKQAMRLDLANTDVTIGAASNPQLLIDFEKVSFEEVSFERGLDSLVTQTLTFKVLYNTSASKAITSCVLTNTVSSY